MTTEIISDVAFNDPSNAIPFVELDEAIFGYRGRCLGLLDFSNPDSYSATGAPANGTTAKSLTSDQGVATANTAWGAVVNGMLPFTVAGANRWTLPNTFKLAADRKRFLQVAWLKMPAAGYSVTGANQFLMLFGEAAASNNAQYGYQLTINAAGAPSQFTANCPGNASGADSVFVPAGAALTSLCNGALHQVAMEWDGSAGATAKKTLYVDGVAVATATVAWDNSAIVQPAQLPHLGYPGQVYSGAYIAGMSIGRPSLWDLTGHPEILATDILTRDSDAAAGYLA